MNKPDKLIGIHNTANELEARIIEDILEKNGIPCVLRPLIALPSAYSPAFLHGTVSINVPVQYAEEARELIKSVNNG